MGRAPCCDKANVKRGPWSPEEDAKLKEFIGKYGTGGNWIALPQKAGLKRCGKSCRLRWLNYLRPNIKHGEFSNDEDRIICNLYANIGSRWSVIAAQLPGRTDNDIKNYWNTKLKKKLMSIPPFFQEKQTFIPSMPFQPPPYDHQTSHQFFNNSSSFDSLAPNFMNVNNISNYHNNVADLQSSPPPPPLPLANNLSYLGFQDDSQMLMFGSTCSSSEGGSYNIDHEQKQKYQVKQEDYYQIALDDHVLGDQVQTQSFMIKNHVTPLHNNNNNNLDQELKQLNFTNYLLHDGDQKGTCSYYY